MDLVGGSGHGRARWRAKWRARRRGMSAWITLRIAWRDAALDQLVKLRALLEAALATLGKGAS